MRKIYKQNKSLLSFWRRWQKKFRIVAIKESTFKELWSIRISSLNIASFLTAFALLIFGFSFLLFAYTPMKAYLPGFLIGDNHQIYVQQVTKTDSLQNELSKQSYYLNNLQVILNGGEIEDSNFYEIPISSKEIKPYTKSSEDSSLRNEIEKEEAYKLKALTIRDKNKLNFLNPINGIVVDTFNINTKHFGIDIAANKNSTIKAIAKGTVIDASWSSKYGYVLIIQHLNNVISVYKHNKKLFPEIGQKVKAGEAIAIIGDTGNDSTGPHLHFEIWKNGKAINPLSLIMY